MIAVKNCTPPSTNSSSSTTTNNVPARTWRKILLRITPKDMIPTDPSCELGCSNHGRSSHCAARLPPEEEDILFRQLESGVFGVESETTRPQKMNESLGKSDGNNTDGGAHQVMANSADADQFLWSGENN
jgi:hypothetical protein